MNPQYSDSGTYKCIASNSKGEDSQSTLLSVTEPPRIISETAPYENFESDTVEVTVGTSIKAKIGSKIIILCPSEGMQFIFKRISRCLKPRKHCYSFAMKSIELSKYFLNFFMIYFELELEQVTFVKGRASLLQKHRYSSTFRGMEKRWAWVA